MHICADLHLPAPYLGDGRDVEGAWVAQVVPSDHHLQSIQVVIYFGTVAYKNTILAESRGLIGVGDAKRLQAVRGR